MVQKTVCANVSLPRVSLSPAVLPEVFYANALVVLSPFYTNDRALSIQF